MIRGTQSEAYSHFSTTVPNRRAALIPHGYSYNVLRSLWLPLIDRFSLVISEYGARYFCVMCQLAMTVVSPSGRGRCARIVGCSGKGKLSGKRLREYIE
jgi:hypothetical protein